MKKQKNRGVVKKLKGDLLLSKPNWEEPLLRILEGHEDLMRETLDFPNLGKIPGFKDLRELERIIQADTTTPLAAGAAVGVVVVVVCVAVAARPGAVTSPELLRAKLLDVYGPKERRRLRDAIAFVQNNPQAIKVALGIDVKQILGTDFMARLESVAAAL